MQEAGITRLARITGLDRVGIPVWQAVRPWSRALSVHQGKGFDDDAARLGAVMEGIESHHAEQWLPTGQTVQSSWASLPAKRRSPSPDDFGRRRGGLDGMLSIQWTEADPVGGGAPFHVPVACVSLDCTQDYDQSLARDSNGQASHLTRDAALLSGMLELVERDAVCEWLAGSEVRRDGTEVDAATVADPMAASILDRLASCGVRARLYRLPAVVAVPVFVAELASAGTHAANHEHVWGSACSFDPVQAVVKALLEALQTRCSQIAGARDTIPLSYDHAGTVRSRIALPRRTGWQGHPFKTGAHSAGGISDLLKLLASAGYRQIGCVELSPASSPVTTVKAFVPGLGFGGRRRRPT